MLRISLLREQRGQEVDLSGGERTRKQRGRDAAGQGDGLASYLSDGRDRRAWHRMLASRRNPAAQGRGPPVGFIRAHLVRDDAAAIDLSVRQSKHAAGERLADNIAEHEDAAGYRVGDSDRQRERRSGSLLPGHAPIITVRPTSTGCPTCPV